MALLSADDDMVYLKIPLGSLGRSNITVNVVNPKHFGPKPSKFVSHLRDVQRRMVANEPWYLKYNEDRELTITHEGVKTGLVGQNDMYMECVAESISATVDMPLAPGTQAGLLQVIDIALAALEPVPGYTLD